jgi:predicted AlkP superfamily pyrophosphatase or phosphodiesterase
MNKQTKPINMKIHVRLLSAYFLIVFLANNGVQAQTANPKNLKTLIVFFDGLREDYITQENMPNLYALKQSGTYGLQHHSVFPTMTRVNSASYATGSYPSGHGLMGNSVYFPEVDKSKGFNSGDANDLMHISENITGQLLTSISLGEVVMEAGSKLMVFSSGSTGQSYLQNHKISRGAIINPDLILPKSIEADILQSIGVPPVASKPNEGRQKWITEAFLKYGLAQDGPLVSAIWYSDPDGTAHSKGIGSAPAMEAISIVDKEFGRVLKAIAAKGLTNSYNIIVSTDHGFVTNIGKKGVSELLVEKGLKAADDSDDVLVVGTAIYVKDQDKNKIKKIVETLQAEDWIGALFTAGKEAGDYNGWVAGTLSYETIHWNHKDRTSDILYAVNWNDDVNKHGYAGSSFAKGVAGHGGSSEHEIHIPFILSGPSFKKGFQSDIPTSNVDIMPTILHAQGLVIPKSVQGRVLEETFVGNPDKIANSKKKIIETSVDLDWGKYQLKLTQSYYNDHIYFDYTKVARKLKTVSK